MLVILGYEAQGGFIFLIITAVTLKITPKSRDLQREVVWVILMICNCKL